MNWSNVELINKVAKGFNTAAQDSNPGSRSRESEALPLSHCALPMIQHDILDTEISIN